jgi:hypothetical protein
VKICVAAVDELRRKERQNETQFTTKIDGLLSFIPPLELLMLIFTTHKSRKDDDNNNQSKRHPTATWVAPLSICSPLHLLLLPKYAFAFCNPFMASQQMCIVGIGSNR